MGLNLLMRGDWLRRVECDGSFAEGCKARCKGDLRGSLRPVQAPRVLGKVERRNESASLRKTSHAEEGGMIDVGLLSSEDASA